MHPCISYYGARTLCSTFPLLLVIGREPNCAQPVSRHVGTYDFAASPKCGFWNASYSLAAATSPQALTARGLKESCSAKSASPILYADALPSGLLNSVRDKRTPRLAVSSEAIDEHVASVLSHDHLIGRVKLVLLSGLHADFCRSVTAYRKQLSGGIRVKALDFFVNSNARRLRAALAADADAFAAVREVIAEFQDWRPIDPNLPAKGGISHVH